MGAFGLAAHQLFLLTPFSFLASRFFRLCPSPPSRAFPRLYSPPAQLRKQPGHILSGVRSTKPAFGVCPVSDHLTLAPPPRPDPGDELEQRLRRALDDAIAFCKQDGDARPFFTFEQGLAPRVAALGQLLVA